MTLCTLTCPAALTRHAIPIAALPTEPLPAQRIRYAMTNVTKKAALPYGSANR